MGFSLRQAEQEELKQQAKRRHEREIQAACQRVNDQQREHKLAQIEREKELERNIAEFAEKRFALFMWCRVYEACSQICSLSDVSILH